MTPTNEVPNLIATFRSAPRQDRTQLETERFPLAVSRWQGIFSISPTELRISEIKRICRHQRYLSISKLAQINQVLALS
jgi:hypothetical protein